MHITAPDGSVLNANQHIRSTSVVDKTELMQLLFPDVPAITWDDVISESSAAGLSPTEVLAAVKKLSAKEEP